MTPSSDRSASNAGIDYCYDQAGRLLYETSYGHRLQCGYDADGNRTRVTFPDANYFTHDYDALNRVAAIRENGAADGTPGVLATYVYDRLSRRGSQARGNGDAVTYSYDAAARLLSLDNDLAGTSNDANWSYGYNDDGQVTTRTLVAAYEVTPATANISYARNGLNQYTTVGAASFSYDARGNLTGDGSRLFCYDLENHLTGEAASGGDACTAPTFALSYDPLGRLHSANASGVTTEFLYDGDRLSRSPVRKATGWQNSISRAAR